MIKDASIQYCAFRTSLPRHGKAERLCTTSICEFSLYTASHLYHFIGELDSKVQFLWVFWLQL